MKCAFGEFHLWYQVALSMVACGKVRHRVVGMGVKHHSGPFRRWGAMVPQSLVLEKLVLIGNCDPVLG